MTRWEKELKEHVYFSNAKELLEKVEVAIEKYKENVEACDELLRLKKVINYAIKFFSNMDPEVTPFNVLTAVNTHLTNITPALNNFIQTGDITYLYNKNNPSAPNTVNTLVNNVISTANTHSVGNIVKPDKSDIEEYSKFVDLFKENASTFIEEKHKLENALQASMNRRIKSKIIRYTRR